MEYNFHFEYPKRDKDAPNSLQKSPTGLTVLCILTFIGSGFLLLAYLLCFFMYRSLPDMMTTVAATMGSSLADYYIKMAEIFRNTPQYFFLQGN